MSPIFDRGFNKKRKRFLRKSVQNDMKILEVDRGECKHFYFEHAPGKRIRSRAKTGAT